MLNFIVIGSQKCGTTWLFEKLKMHPKIYFPLGKEVGHWNHKFYQSEVHRNIYNNFMNNSLVEMSNYVCGDMSTFYALMPIEQIEKLYNHHPNIKLFLMVRNPILRAWSAIKMTYVYKKMDFHQLTNNKIKQAITHGDTSELGKYDIIIKKWLKFFKPEQLKIIFFDDIPLNYRVILRDFCEFVDIQPEFFDVIPDSLLKSPSLKGIELSLSPEVYNSCIEFYRPSINFLASYTSRNLDDWSSPITSYNQINRPYNIVICAIMKNEAPYILEWIAYHRVIKVDHFLIYNNDSTDETAEILQRLDEAGIITCIDWSNQPDGSHQKTAYQDAFQKLQDKCNWIAFIDADEFIVPNKELDLSTFLSKYSRFDAIAINWKLFGSSGHKFKTPGLVMERFIKSGQENSPVNMHFKTIVKPDAIKDLMNPHKFQLLKNKQYIYPDLTPVSQKSPRCGPYINHDLIQINHYFTKSKAEWDLKRARGRATIKSDSPSKFRPEKQFYSHDKNEEEDLLILRFLEATKKEIEFLTKITGLEKLQQQLTHIKSSDTPQSISILDVIKIPVKDSDLLWGYNIGKPSKGETITNEILTIRGWILGKKCSINQIEIVYQNTSIAKTLVNKKRPHIAKRYPEISLAEHSGFNIQFNFANFLSKLNNNLDNFIIQAIDENKNIIPVAEIKFQLN